MNSWAQGEGQPGLGYIMWREGGEGAGPLANNIGAERTAAIRGQLGLKEGDAAFFVAGDPDKFWKFSGLARTRVGENGYTVRNRSMSASEPSSTERTSSRPRNACSTEGEAAKRSS